MYLITYENQLLALSNFRNEYFKEFHFIQEKYNLPTLTEKSYLLYLNKFTDFMQEYYENEVANEKFYNFNNDEIDLFELDFLAFNDIFENKKDNEVIKELINKINFEQTTKKLPIISYTEDSIIFDSITELIGMIPVDSELNLEISNIINHNKEEIEPLLSGSEVTRAINYAISWYYRFNPNYRNFTGSGGDCINFVSQAIHAGGRPMSPLWHHQKTALGGDGPFGFTSSPSWTRVGNFLSHWGSSVSSPDFQRISTFLRPGDVLLVDFGSDRNPDHSGLVTTIGGTISGYTNFKIAQHTSEYHDWASNKSGWRSRGYYWIVRP